MKRLILILSVCLFLFSCSKTEELNTLTVNVKMKYGTSTVLPITKDITLYLFKNVSIHSGYTYAGNGYLQSGTGEKILYSQKVTTSSAFYIFRDLEKVTHTVVVDGVDIFNDKVKIKNYSASENLGNDLTVNGGSIEFVFDLWPYVPSDVLK